MFDKNGNGLVSVHDLKHSLTTLGERLADEELDELVREVDQDGEGQLNYEGGSSTWPAARSVTFRQTCDVSSRQCGIPCTVPEISSRMGVCSGSVLRIAHARANAAYKRLPAVSNVTSSYRTT